MFDELFERPHALARQLSGSLLEERRIYLAHCFGQGMKIATVKCIAEYLLGIAEFLNLKQRPDRRITLDEITNAANRWASRKPRPAMMQDTTYTKRRFIWYATQWLGFLDRLEIPCQPSTPLDYQLTEFAEFTCKEQGLSSATVTMRHSILRKFLGPLCDGGHPLDTITVVDIDTALINRVNQAHYARVTVQTTASILRAFFRYAEVRCWCAKGLAASIMAPRTFHHESLPRGPSWDDVRNVLTSTSGSYPTDIRDHAILLLLAIYGLRAGEVVRLRLEDIDWDKELILFRRSKQHHSQSYPLSQPVGEAIIRYLKEVRPRSAYREVFLTRRAPVRPLRSGTLWPIVGRRLRSLGLSLKHHGPHALRHACATRLINEGLSLKEIGDHLGHRNPDTTRIYAKVDLTGLRKVANFDLGGLL